MTVAEPVVPAVATEARVAVFEPAGIATSPIMAARETVADPEDVVTVIVPSELTTLVRPETATSVPVSSRE
jgi:hypothetical protein